MAVDATPKYRRAFPARLPPALLLAAALGSAGCSALPCPDGNCGDTDAGAPSASSSSAAPVSSSQARDGGRSSSSSAATSAAETSSSFQSPDAGAAGDAGTRPDASAAPDAGTAHDAGAPASSTSGILPVSSSSAASSGTATSTASSSTAPSSSASPSSSVGASSSAMTSSSSAGPPSSSSGFEVAFTLAILPDTQHYSNEFPEIYTAQTQWLRDHGAEYRVVYVFHEGDFTHNATPREWGNADTAMSILDGVLPWAFVYGNHDLGPGGNSADRSTLAETVFPVSRFENVPGFGDSYELASMANSYHLFSAGGTDFVALMLEFGPRDQVLEWAAAVCSYYATRQVILVTHSYLDENDHRCGTGCDYNPHWYGLGREDGGTINDGEEMWQKLVRKHANIRLVLNGHHLGDGLGRLISVGDHGNLVVQIFTNFQVRPMGGEGYLRLLEFNAEQTLMRVRTFSPWVEPVDPERAWLKDGQSQYTVDLVHGTFLDGPGPERP